MTSKDSTRGNGHLRFPQPLLYCRCSDFQYYSIYSIIEMCLNNRRSRFYFYFCCTWVNGQTRKTILRTTHICSQEVTIPLRPCASQRTPLLDLAYYRTSTLQHCDVVDEPTGPAFRNMDDKDHLRPYLATFQATKSSSKTALRYNEKKNEYQVRGLLFIGGPR